MTALSGELSQYLEALNQRNNETCDIDGIPGGNRYRGLRFDPERNMFVIFEGESVQSGYDGHENPTGYYFDGRLFLPYAESLRQDERAAFENGVSAIRTTRSYRWNHTYSSPDDSERITLQKGRAFGEISAPGLKLVLENLKFTPDVRPVTLYDDTGDIEDAEFNAGFDRVLGMEEMSREEGLRLLASAFPSGRFRDTATGTVYNLSHRGPTFIDGKFPSFTAEKWSRGPGPTYLTLFPDELDRFEEAD